ncbi:hypothetical protein Tco_0021817 [Tanacetum coccineum]
MDLIAYSDSDYAYASLDRKSITGAEYIAASNCCGQVLWLQNQLLNYGYNFMKTKIHVDNESEICVVKNLVYHSKTKHIEIRHSYEKKLIEMVKIHTDYNVADESPLHNVHSLGRDEGSLSLTELTVLCTNLSNKVTSLESELQQTKQTYNAALTKLIKRVKKLEQTIKTSQARRRAKIAVSEDENALEDSSKQGMKISDIDEDPNISLVVLEEEEPIELIEDQGSGEKGDKEVTTPANFQTYIRRRRDVSTGSGRVSTASRQDGTADVSTASEIGSTAG